MVDAGMVPNSGDGDGDDGATTHAAHAVHDEQNAGTLSQLALDVLVAQDAYGTHSKHIGGIPGGQLGGAAQSPPSHRQANVLHAVSQ